MSFVLRLFLFYFVIPIGCIICYSLVLALFLYFTFFRQEEK